MKKFILLSNFILIITCNMFAIPANPNPVTIKLTDGTEVTYYIKGDEKVHWNQSPDGYTLLYNDSKNLVYAEKNADGDLVPSDVPYLGVASSKYSSAERSKISSLSKDLRYSK
jgi:hypothetical protein